MFERFRKTVLAAFGFLLWLTDGDVTSWYSTLLRNQAASSGPVVDTGPVEAAGPSKCPQFDFTAAKIKGRSSVLRSGARWYEPLRQNRLGPICRRMSFCPWLRSEVSLSW